MGRFPEATTLRLGAGGRLISMESKLGVQERTTVSGEERGFALPADPFDYTTIPAGHYDRVYRRGRGIQSKWHHLKFERVAAQIYDRRRVLDVGRGPRPPLRAPGDAHEAVRGDITAPPIAHADETYARPQPALL